MGLSKEEIIQEEKRLGDTINLIRSKISVLGQELYERDDKVLEFKKFMWDNRSDMDPSELKTMMSDNDLEIRMMMNKGEYLQKLFKIQNNPYFGSIIFKSDEGVDEVYIGITHVTDDNNKYYVNGELGSLYDTSYLLKKDKYSYFLGGNKSLITIDNYKGSGDILIIKDSYANCFVPYVVKDYRRVHVIDPRYFNKSISEYIKENNIKEVLFVYNVLTLDEDLGILNINS